MNWTLSCSPRSGDSHPVPDDFTQELDSYVMKSLCKGLVQIIWSPSDTFFNPSLQLCKCQMKTVEATLMFKTIMIGTIKDKLE